MLKLILRVTGAIHTWALARLVEKHPRARAEVRRLIGIELGEIANTVRYQKTERAILAARLSRRYDPGMALNEAANRAIAAKRAEGQPAPGANLTGKQLAALEFQKAYLKRVVDRS